MINVTHSSLIGNFAGGDMQTNQLFLLTNQSVQNTTPGVEVMPNRSGADYHLRTFCLPILIVLGGIGNTFSAVFFLGKSLRGYSCCIFLGVRSIIDNIFIVTLFVAWLDFLNVRIFHTAGLCQVTVFMAYVCSFVSVWCVVCVTIENYIRVSHSMLTKLYCTPRTAIMIICVLIVTACCIYNMPLWSNNIVEIYEKYYCVPNQEFEHLQLILTYIDAAMSLIIPLIIIVSLMCLICIKSMEASKRKLRLGHHRSRYRSAPSFTTVAGLLTAVSLTFLCLHTPIYVYKLKVIIEHESGNFERPTETSRIIGNIFQVMYYLNCSINFLVYYVCGSNFRKVFLDGLCGRCSVCRCYEEVEEDRISDAGTTELTVILDQNYMKNNT